MNSEQGMRHLVRLCVALTPTSLLRLRRESMESEVAFTSKAVLQGAQAGADAAGFGGQAVGEEADRASAYVK